MVLEARYKAEKIEYPVVWEKAKGNPDVVDYNIREEWTKDTSAEINANNQTTTGMATIIPWVNAPKLIENTSVITRSQFVKATLSATTGELEPWDAANVREFSVSDVVWLYNIQFVSWKGMQIPVAWTYQLTITYPSHWSFHYFNTRLFSTTRSGRKTIVDHTWTTWGTSDVETETIERTFNAWDYLWGIIDYVYVWSGTWANRTATISIAIRRLW